MRDRYRRRPSWTFFGFGSSILLGLFAAAVAVTLTISAWLLAETPEYTWNGLELFSKQIYYLEKIPVFVDFTALGFIVAVTLLVSITFSIYPAYRAAKANPIEAMRDE